MGLVYLGLATAAGVETRRLDMGPEQPRDIIQHRSAKIALNWVRFTLLSWPDGHRDPERWTNVKSKELWNNRQVRSQYDDRINVPSWSRAMSVEPAVLFRSMEQLLNQGSVAGLDERALLERFATHRDGRALAVLISTYGPMVLGVCRRFLREPQDVEDAFQSTFLVLVRRAGSIRDPRRLGRLAARRSPPRSRCERGARPGGADRQRGSNRHP